MKFAHAGEMPSCGLSAWTDRTCTRCEPGTFSTGEDAEQCEPWMPCAAGEYVATAGTRESGQECAPCEEGTFSAGGGSRCTKWSECSDHTFEVAAGTERSDRVCEPPGFSLASVTEGGEPADGSSTDPSLSADGRFIAFSSMAANLASDDSDDIRDVFVRALETGTVRRVSVATNGTQSNPDSGGVQLSGDGRCVLFSSAATNLESGAASPKPAMTGPINLYLHDTRTSETRRVNLAQGTPGAASISTDGRYVAYGVTLKVQTGAFVETHNYIYSYGVETRETERADRTSDGGEPDRGCSSPSLSEDGRFIAFTSVA